MSNLEPVIDPREQLDLLVSRIADGEADEHDWGAFNALAEKMPDAWKHLARAQREHSALSMAVGVALHGAERVELPTAEAAELFTARRHAPTHIRTLSRLGAYSGWAAAAAVALVAWNGAFRGGGAGEAGPGSAGDGNVASIVPAGFTVNSPDDAVKAYLNMGGRNGSVIGELPRRVVVDSEPTTLNGGQRGVRVIYIRQFVEQAVVTDLARVSTDEAGRVIALPAAPSVPPPVPGPQ